ncbi:MAG: AraC family transcriptional regulator, partial [Pseudomonadota bacterium]
MNTNRDIAAIRSIERVLTYSNVTDLVGRIEPDSVVMRPNTEICGTRFTIGAHESEIGRSQKCALILSKRSRGNLHADISGERMNASIRSGSLTFMPTGVSQTFAFDGETTNTVLAIEPDLIERAARSDHRLGGLASLAPRLSFVRPSLERLVEECYQTMADADAGWRVLSESIALRIAYELLVVFKGAPAGTATPLSPAEIDRLVDFVDMEMENNFDLSDMAALLDRDPFGFIRSFKAATGESPHQFVIQRRVAKVKELLLHSHDSLAEIAYAAGFANQSHMTSTFSKQVGMPPGKWRK